MGQLLAHQLHARSPPQASSSPVGRKAELGLPQARLVLAARALAVELRQGGAWQHGAGRRGGHQRRRVQLLLPRAKIGRRHRRCRESACQAYIYLRVRPLLGQGRQRLPRPTPAAGAAQSRLGRLGVTPQRNDACARRWRARQLPTQGSATGLHPCPAPRAQRAYEYSFTFSSTPPAKNSSLQQQAMECGGSSRSTCASHSGHGGATLAALLPVLCARRLPPSLVLASYQLVQRHVGRVERPAGIWGPVRHGDHVSQRVQAPILCAQVRGVAAHGGSGSAPLSPASRPHLASPSTSPGCQHAPLAGKSPRTEAGHLPPTPGSGLQDWPASCCRGARQPAQRLTRVAQVPHGRVVVLSAVPAPVHNLYGLLRDARHEAGAQVPGQPLRGRACGQRLWQAPGGAESVARPGRRARSSPLGGSPKSGPSPPSCSTRDAHARCAPAPAACAPAASPRCLRAASGGAPRSSTLRPAALCVRIPVPTSRALQPRQHPTPPHPLPSALL